MNQVYTLPTPIRQCIERMPKVEMHVHLEGSIQPATLLALAERNRVTLPASSVDELREWYRFTDFAHFIEIYMAICACIRTPDDLELIAFEFLRGQARQNIRYSEVIFTPYTHYPHIPFEEQLAAINRARMRAADELGVYAGLVPDIARQVRPIEHSLLVAEWAIASRDQGVIALGLGGPEIGNPPELFQQAFDMARDVGLPSLPHAGETEGPASIRGALDALHAVRIGHGVRCLEDPALVARLREQQVPLDVSPSSNVCLGVAASIDQHPLPRLLAEGLLVTINSDDPPMFNTTLTDEYLRITAAFGFEMDQIEQLVLNGVRVSLLPDDARRALEEVFRAEFRRLRSEVGL